MARLSKISEEVLRARVRERLDATGKKPIPLAEEIGRGRDYIYDFLAEKKHTLSVSALQDIAALTFTRLPYFLDALEPLDAPRSARSLDPIEVPLISWVSAGRLAEMAPREADPSAPTILQAGLEPGDYFALRVAGDSMDRLSPEGSIVVVNRAEVDPIANRPFVFARGGETTYKLWFPDPQRLEPYSTNPTNRALFPRDDEEWRVIGRVRRTVLDL